MSDAKLHSQDRFNQYAHSYVNSLSHQNAPELDRLFEMVAPQPDWVVLDVATGAGKGPSGPSLLESPQKW